MTPIMFKSYQTNWDGNYQWYIVITHNIFQNKAKDVNLSNNS